MKKLLILLLLCFVLVSCKMGEGLIQDGDENNQVGNFTLSATASSLKLISSSSYTTTVKIFATNNGEKSANIIIESAKLVNEKTKKEYVADEPGSMLQIKSSHSDSKTEIISTPTSVEEDKYYVVIGVRISSMFYGIKFKLYEEEKEMITLTYKLDGEVIKEERIEADKPIENVYVYDSEDRLLYCDTWYREGNEALRIGMKFYYDTVLEGTLEFNYNTSSVFGSDETIINELKHVPLDGTVYIPRTINDKPVRIGVAVFSDNDKVRNIYIPSDVVGINDENFVNCENLQSILYEGSQEEWISLFTSSEDATIYNIGISYNCDFFEY